MIDFKNPRVQRIREIDEIFYMTFAILDSPFLILKILLQIRNQ